MERNRNNAKKAQYFHPAISGYPSKWISNLLRERISKQHVEKFGAAVAGGCCDGVVDDAVVEVCHAEVTCIYQDTGNCHHNFSLCFENVCQCNSHEQTGDKFGSVFEIALQYDDILCKNYGA